MNKKKSIIFGIILVVLILGGLAFYQYSVSNHQVNNNINQENTDQENNNLPEIELGGIGVEGSYDSDSAGDTGPQGGLIVCVDKCGDGICQDIVSDCNPNSLNCICQENVQECSQDCK